MTQPFDLHRVFSFSDRLVQELDLALKTCTYRADPAPSVRAQESLSLQEQELSASLMRVNHAGEVCAQALYRGHALLEKNAATRKLFEHSADEELDHLQWTAQRLAELNSQPSLLNPLWYLGAFTLGAAASVAGQRINLGLMAETERQVESHLQGHLEQLPQADTRSRELVQRMQADEAQHRESALQAGAAEPPLPVRMAMRAAAKVMTTLAHRV